MTSYASLSRGEFWFTIGVLAVTFVLAWKFMPGQAAVLADWMSRYTRFNTELLPLRGYLVMSTSYLLVAYFYMCAVGIFRDAVIFLRRELR
ncbi:hypothetical protein [Paracoccus broussonetiae]|nr:hypothetical protein [Paracoccus sp. CPCC 101403]